MHIRLQVGAAVDAPYIALGQIAVVDTADVRIRQQLEALRIGRTARVGYRLRVSRREIASRIERAFPGLYRRLSWEGPSASTVRTHGTHFEVQRYVNVAEAFLRDWLRRQVREYQISAVGRLRDLEVPRGSIEAVARWGAPPEHISRRMCVWIDIAVEGEPYQSLPVWFAVSAFDEVLTARSDLVAGRVLEPELLQPEVRDLALIRGKPLRAGAVPEEKRLRVAVASGEALTEEVLTPVPAVAAGQQVTVQATVGHVSLTTLAIAAEDGEVGTRIRVRPPDGDASYAVRVVGKGLVYADGG